MTAGELIVVLEQRRLRVKPRPGGTGWRSQCPVCRSAGFKLSVSVGRDDRQLLHCFRCEASFADFCGALGLKPSAFFGWSPYRESCARPSLLTFSVGGWALGTSEGLCPNSYWHLGSATGNLDELRAVAEHGHLRPLTVRLALPPGAGARMRAVAADLEQLFGLRAAVGDWRPLPYAASWPTRVRPGARLAIEPPDVARVLRSFASSEARTVVLVASSTRRGKRRPSLYVPGPRTVLGWSDVSTHTANDAGGPPAVGERS
jgi:hypothetical protein